VVLCGITPGIQQAVIAIRAAQAAIEKGLSQDEVLAIAKQTASFAGSMRKNLVAMLDHVGLHRYLGIQSTSALFGERADLVHYTSALRNPVLSNGKNYSGGANMARIDYLWQSASSGLKTEIDVLPNDAVFVPLGPSVDSVFERMVAERVLERSRVLIGLPHPSGANAERIAYFCERKDRAALSNKTNPDSLDQRRALIIKCIRQLDRSSARA